MGNRYVTPKIGDSKFFVIVQDSYMLVIRASEDMKEDVIPLVLKLDFVQNNLMFDPVYLASFAVNNEKCVSELSDSLERIMSFNKMVTKQVENNLYSNKAVVSVSMSIYPTPQGLKVVATFVEDDKTVNIHESCVLRN
ncbi:hypothetical protein D3C71_1779220 [compost metagenome]